MRSAGSRFLILSIFLSTTLTASAGVNPNAAEHAAIAAVDSRALTLEFNAADIQRREVEHEGDEFENYFIEGEGIVFDDGMPVLPAISRFVVVPPRAGLELVVNGGLSRPMRSILPPAPTTAEMTMITLNAQPQEPTGLYPPEIAVMEGPFIIRGVRLVQVTTYPLQYDFDAGSYIHHPNIQTEIRFTDDPPVNPVDQPIRRNRSREFLKFISGLAINGDEVGRDDPDYDQDPEYIGHYAVATHESGLRYIAPFIEWRRKSGYKVDIFSFDNNTASGNPNAVKTALRNKYQEYVEDGIDPFDLLLLVGDRSAYENQPGPGWRLEAERGESVWGGANHGDYKFACVDGNDNNPDVAFSRWPGGSEQMLGLMVGRTLGYEATPFMDDTDWFTRGGVYSQHWGNSPNQGWHITIPNSVRWGEEVLKHLGFDDIAFYENYDYDREGNAVGPWTRDQINAGTNVLVGRAENYYYPSRGGGPHDFNGDIRETRIFPVDINTSGHGEWARETMYRVNGGHAGNLKGYVATSYGWGWTETLSMNVVWMEWVNAVLQRRMTYGWGRMAGIIGFREYIANRAHFRGGQQIYDHVMTDVDAFGDPGLKAWIGVPRIVEAAFPEEISPETRLYEVSVTDPDDDSPVAGAQVTLYAPGDMPAFNHNNYATYDDMFVVTKKSDADGRAVFVIDEGVDLDGDVLYVTVTGEGIVPFFGEADISARRPVVEVDEYAVEITDGNQGDVVNPGETIALTLTAVNLSNQVDIEGVTAVVGSESPWVEVEDNEIAFGDIAAGETAEAEAPVTIHVSPACPDGASRPVTKPQIVVEFTSGEETWRSAIELEVSAPHFQVARVMDGDIIDVGRHDLDIEIENIGSAAAEASSVQISSLGLGVSVVRETAAYPAIASGRSARIAGEGLVVAGNQLAIPGSRTKLMLVFTTDNDFVDTTFFELQVGRAGENAPFGPDIYGYICFDDTDDDWDIAPQYEWIEISRRENDRDFDGVACDFNDNSPHDRGEVEVVDLGFETQFYGHVYDQISITSNGYISFGNQPRIVNFQNWPMDQGFGGGVGMVAAWWDDLMITNNSGVYYFYDEDEHRFIVEWYKLRHRQGGNQDLTFQIIILDKDVWITETGDPNIIVQYKSIADVQNVRAGSTPWIDDTPFASVGISSPDGNSGLSVRWNNNSPDGIPDFRERRALLYGTSPRYRSGFLHGHVTDVETGEPVEGATVYTQHGFTAATDSSGYWRIIDALAEVPFDITATKLGYNDSTYTELVLAEDDTMEIDFALLHPEFTPSQGELGAIMGIDASTEIEFEAFNGGNGPLEWSVIKRLRGDANAAPWELRRNYNAGVATDDNRLEGVVFIEDFFYVTGHSAAPTIYIIDREGGLVDFFDQPGADDGYMRDLAWDGELIWGCAGEIVYGFTPEGEVVTSFEGPYNPNTAIAWDPDRQVLFLSSTTANPMAYDREGNNLADLNLRRLDLRIYGLSYWPEDPDGFPLYFYHSPTAGLQVVTKMNPDNNDTMSVRLLDTPGRPGGAYVTNQFDVYSWVFMLVANDGSNDRIDIYQLDARRDWFNIDRDSGVLNPEESQDFTLTLDAADLPPVVFEGDLVFYHNAEGGETIIPVTLDVQVGAGDPDVRTLSLHNGWNTVSLNVEPEVDDIIQMMAPLVENDLLVLMKDGQGRFYLPSEGFNSIPRWDFADGYQIYTGAAADLEIAGIVIAGDEPIILRQGWNLKAYYPRLPSEAMFALEGIREQLILAKDGYGHFYMPSYGFSNLGDLREGMGYYYKVSEDVALSYRFEELGALAYNPALSPTHFIHAANTGANMSALILGSPAMAGFELAAFGSSRICAGAGVFDAAGRCGMAIWGDDAATVDLDGLRADEALSFRLWDGAGESTLRLTPVEGAPVWSQDGIFVGSADPAAALPDKFGLTGAYPNPFNAAVRLRFGLVNAGETHLTIHDLTGRVVAELAGDYRSAGYHSLTWNAGPAPSGIYFARLSQTGSTSTSKVMLVR